MAAIENPDMSLRLRLLSDLGWFWCKRLLFERDVNGAMMVLLRKARLSQRVDYLYVVDVMSTGQSTVKSLGMLFLLYALHAK
jgi:hypothetical protein